MRMRGVDSLTTGRPEEGMNRLLLVDAAVLPEVFARVVEAKQYLLSGAAASASSAARLAGISRSAFYKYKDAVFAYQDRRTGEILTLHLVLQDRPGVLSRVLSAFADAGANILTVNQNIPADGYASVSVSARTDGLGMPLEGFVRRLTSLDGVQRIVHMAGEAEDVR